MALDYAAATRIKPPEIEDSGKSYQTALNNRLDEQKIAENELILEDTRAKSEQAREQRMRDAAIKKAIASSATPFDAAQRLDGLDPQAATQYRGQLADQTARLLQGVSSYQAWPSVRPVLEKYIGPQAPESMPAQFRSQAEFDAWKRSQLLAHADLKTYLAETKPSAMQDKTREITVTNPDGSTTIKIVKDEPGQEFMSAPKPVTANNPTEASLALAAANGDKAAAAALRIMRKQRQESGEGGGSSTDRARLVDAVMANPAMWADITPTVKTAIGADLAARGFKFGSQGSSKPPTGAQNKVLGFFNRAKQADEDLQQLEPAVAQMGLAGQTRMAMAPNWAQSQQGQSYNQAQRAFTEARLRKDSGAAIPESEFANDRRTYFAQPGDSPETLAQKARARAAVLASLAFESGPALTGFYGDEDASSMIADYRSRAAQPGRSNAPIQRAIPSIPGGIAESTDGGKTWKRVK